RPFRVERVMPDMPVHEEALFKAACQIGSAQGRAEFVRQACGDDSALVTRVSLLLRAYENHPGFLESPPQAVFPTIDWPAEEPPTKGPGTLIGPYKLIEQIGEGGFGVVYMAEQTQPVRRKVALKILKPGMDTRQ